MFPQMCQEVCSNTNEHRKVWVYCFRNLDWSQARVPFDGTMSQEDFVFHFPVIFRSQAKGMSSRASNCTNKVLPSAVTTVIFIKKITDTD